MDFSRRENFAASEFCMDSKYITLKRIYVYQWKRLGFLSPVGMRTFYMIYKGRLLQVSGNLWFSIFHLFNITIIYNIFIIFLFSFLIEAVWIYETRDERKREKIILMKDIWLISSRAFKECKNFIWSLDSYLFFYWKAHHGLYWFFPKVVQVVEFSGGNSDKKSVSV